MPSRKWVLQNRYSAKQPFCQESLFPWKYALNNISDWHQKVLLKSYAAATTLGRLASCFCCLKCNSNCRAAWSKWLYINLFSECRWINIYVKLRQKGNSAPAEPWSRGDRAPLRSRAPGRVSCGGTQAEVVHTDSLGGLRQNGEGCLQVPLWFCSQAENLTAGIWRNNKRLCKSRTAAVPLGEMSGDCFQPIAAQGKCGGEFIVTTLGIAAEWLET